MNSDEYITQLALEEFPEANPYKKKCLWCGRIPSRFWQDTQTCDWRCHGQLIIMQSLPKIGETKMKTYTMLEKFIRRFQKSREWRDRLYHRYLCWCSGRISRGHLGRHIPRSEVRDLGLVVRNFNRS